MKHVVPSWMLAIAAATGVLVGTGGAGSAGHPIPIGAQQPVDGKLQDTLVALERRSWEAWKNRDGRFFQDFLSDDHVEIGFSGVADKATVVAGVGSPICAVQSYSVDRFRLTVFDANTALLTYHAEQDTTCGGKPVPSPVWVGSLYVRRGERWYNAAYQQSQASTAAPKPKT